MSCDSDDSDVKCASVSNDYNSRIYTGSLFQYYRQEKKNILLYWVENASKRKRSFWENRVWNLINLYSVRTRSAWISTKISTIPNFLYTEINMILAYFDKQYFDKQYLFIFIFEVKRFKIKLWKTLKMNCLSMWHKDWTVKLFFASSVYRTN